MSDRKLHTKMAGGAERDQVIRPIGRAPGPKSGPSLKMMHVQRVANALLASLAPLAAVAVTLTYRLSQLAPAAPLAKLSRLVSSVVRVVRPNPMQPMAFRGAELTTTMHGGLERSECLTALNAEHRYSGHLASVSAPQGAMPNCAIARIKNFLTGPAYTLYRVVKAPTQMAPARAKRHLSTLCVIRPRKHFFTRWTLSGFSANLLEVLAPFAAKERSTSVGLEWFFTETAGLYHG